MIRLATGLVLALVLAGCGGRATGDATRPVTIALPATINTLDPHMTASVPTDLSVLSHIYPALVLRGPDLRLQPSLATSWTPVDDHSWEFELTPGARFANGEPIDAAAVKWNVDRVRDPATKARIKTWFEPIVRVETPSPTTVRIVTDGPFPSLPDQLSMFFLLPPKWAASHKPATETMAGGRYEVTDYVPGDHISLRARTGYWGEPPAVRDLVFRVVPEPLTRIAGLKTGDLDLITAIPPSEIAGINASGKATAGSTPSTRSVIIKINTEVAPTKARAFRQALNYAVDKEAIARSIFNGLASPSTCQLLTPDYLGYNPSLKPYPYDPAKARALLREAGLPREPVRMDVPVGIYLHGQEVAQAVAAQLEAVGLKVALRETDFGGYMARYLTTHELPATSLLAQAWPTLDAGGVLNMYATGSPYAYFSNPEFDALLEKGRATMDPAQRVAAYARATELMCREAPVIFLYVQPSTYGTSRRVRWLARGDDWVRGWDLIPVARGDR